MTTPLWSWNELIAAAHATPDGEIAGAVSGYSIDTRTLEPGNVFVALTVERDGHDFVQNAFAAGASTALVRENYERQNGDGLLLRVDDPLKALERIGIAARARLSDVARVIAVTGSAGKTTTKEMLRQCLETQAPGRVHASIKSYNNHWGVPLTLANMPRDTRFGVFEIGMNNPDEIRPLTTMVRPHVAVVTSVLPVHIGNFTDGIKGIAMAKAEIFEGLIEGGTAIVNAESEQAAVLRERAAQHGAKIVTFSLRDEHAADVHGRPIRVSGDHASLSIDAGDGAVEIDLGVTGNHMMSNATAAVTAMREAGIRDLKSATVPLATFSAGAGRGARIELQTAQGPFLLIDESYNANPASVEAAIGVMAHVAKDRQARTVAVLGDMLELGEEAEARHRALAEPIRNCEIDVVLACGPMMRALTAALPASVETVWAETSDGLKEPLLEIVQAGDVVMIKGSLGSKMGPLTDALKASYAVQRGT